MILTHLHFSPEGGRGACPLLPSFSKVFFLSVMWPAIAGDLEVARSYFFLILPVDRIQYEDTVLFPDPVTLHAKSQNPSFT